MAAPAHRPVIEARDRVIPDTAGRGWTCLCHFRDGSEGVYAVEHERLLRGSQTAIAGLEGLWTVTEMIPPDEGAPIDAEIWVEPAHPS